MMAGAGSLRETRIAEQPGEHPAWRNESVTGSSELTESVSAARADDLLAVNR
jgi:hypothetical protein